MMIHTYTSGGNNMESYEDIKRQRDFYKSQVDNYENIVDYAKIVIVFVIGLLTCCIEF